ncbi:hypothetical protein [Caminibacter sp.]
MKILYIDGKEHQNITLHDVDDEGKQTLNPVIPTDLEAFRAICFSTLDYNLKKMAQSKADNIVASAKIDVLLAKMLNTLTPKTANLTASEKKVWNNLTLLAKNGYSDSNIPVDATQGVIDVVTIAQTKAAAIAKATTHEELFGLL